MKVLIVGEDREGSLLRSFRGVFKSRCDVTTLDPSDAATAIVDDTSLAAKLRRRRIAMHTRARFAEAVEDLEPDVTFVIKGRGLDSRTIARARAHTRVAVYYPDNPLWLYGWSRSALAMFCEADLSLIWSERIAEALRPDCRRMAVVPFGYDAEWFPLAEPDSDRAGVAFVGTWSFRRERFLRALLPLPLTVVGTGWQAASDITSSAPIYGKGAGTVLQQAAIAVNVLHPHNAGSHNMRTREIAACGSVQLTDPGTDGTPLRDGVGCRWFRSPEHLRALVDELIDDAPARIALARDAQQLVGVDSYATRADALLQLFERLI